MSSGGALFGGGGRQSHGSKALVEFKAGKLHLNGTKMSADTRKGLVFVEVGDDDLIHFKWKDRTKGDVEDDLIIFQDDVEYNQVKQCTDGRVFVLKLKSSNAKHFFWMQEPNPRKDEEYWQKIVEVVKDPPSKGRNGGGSGLALTDLPGLEMSNLRDSELQTLLSHMSQQQLLHLFGPSRHRRSGGPGADVRPSAAQSTSTTTASTGSTARETTSSASSSATTTTTSSSSSSSSKPPIQLAQLQSILSGLKVPPGLGSSSGPEVDLAAGLSLDVLQPLLENPDFVQKMKVLLPEVPGEDNSQLDHAQEIKSTIQSPQFKQALSIFSSGFQTGQLAPLIREFELGEEAVQAATSGDLEAFVTALQKNPKNATEPKSAENMDLD